MNEYEEPLQQLLHFVSSLDLEQAGFAFEHQSIYNYIEQTIISSTSNVSISAPPPPITIWALAANTILGLPFKHDSAPLLLDILTIIETYRTRTISQAEKLLTLNSYHKSSANKDFLEKLNVSSTSWRQAYLTIIQTCCHSDMYHLWTESTPSITNFLIHFNKFFPFLNEYCTNQVPLLFHLTLSPSERDTLVATGLDIAEWVIKSVQWAENNIVEGESLWSPFQSNQFSTLFPSPCTNQQLINMISKYLRHVMSIVERVDNILVKSP
ncbi:hypothetical protein AMATHDRAFT_38592 [Amanita thiersii Skay4041]|uniref:Uncharacterized protein n=1 Tax=Amanita thiersii Skay4041 TaxID=703135 RepID=A0A2A9NS01_9AGAR|nr:hypothetical protein AMATHDRAFT_38592 [Amanita thiersii Skay4041]